MKTFLPFLLLVVAITAAPAAQSMSKKRCENSENCITQEKRLKDNVHHLTLKPELRRPLLKEIIDAANHLKTQLSDKVLRKWVPGVLQNECTLEDMCTAGRVLREIKLKDLGLKAREWILPRRLLSYTKGTNCSIPETATVKSSLSVLLQNIHQCALDHHSKAFTASPLSAL